MRKISGVLVAALLAALVLAGCAKSPVHRTITAKVTPPAGAGFAPDTLRVKKGDKVEITVKNAAFGVPHNLTCFDRGAGIELSENLGMFRGQKRDRFTPTKAGEYDFYCHVGSHAKKGMTGKLVVVE